jgi:hypothetical protein
MKTMWVCVPVVLFGTMNLSVGAENPLSISVIKTERSSAKASYILMSVENKSDQRFEDSQWSCVFFDRGQPVHEERNSVENVPPRGRAVKREIQGYGGPFDNIECRFMRSRPSVCP